MLLGIAGPGRHLGLEIRQGLGEGGGEGGRAVACGLCGGGFEACHVLFQRVDAQPKCCQGCHIRGRGAACGGGGCPRQGVAEGGQLSIRRLECCFSAGDARVQGIKACAEIGEATQPGRGGFRLGHRVPGAARRLARSHGRAVGGLLQGGDFPGQPAAVRLEGVEPRLHRRHFVGGEIIRQGLPVEPAPADQAEEQGRKQPQGGPAAVMRPCGGLLGVPQFLPRFRPGPVRFGDDLLGIEVDHLRSDGVVSGVVLIAHHGWT